MSKVRVVFFSKHDMSRFRSLERAEKLLLQFNPELDLGINDLFEFYNIKLYFENDLYLSKWTEDQKNDFKQVVESQYERLKHRLIEISKSDFSEIIKELDFDCITTWITMDMFLK